MTGKSAATDILSRKKSLPVLYGLGQSAELVELYGREPFGQEEVNAAVSILDAVGAQATTIAYETRFYNQAIEALERATPQGTAAVGLRKLTESLFQRAY